MLKLTMKTPERRQRLYSTLFIIKFEQFSRLALALFFIDFE